MSAYRPHWFVAFLALSGAGFWLSLLLAWLTLAYAESFDVPPCDAGFEEQPNPNPSTSCYDYYGSGGIWVGMQGPKVCGAVDNTTSRIDSVTAALPDVEAKAQASANCTGTKSCTNFRVGTCSSNPCVLYDQYNNGTFNLTLNSGTGTAWHIDSTPDAYVCMEVPPGCDTTSPDIGKTYSYEVPWDGVSLSAGFPAGYCDADTSCRAVKTGGLNICMGSSCFGSYRLTSQECMDSVGDPDPTVEEPPPTDPDPTWGTSKCEVSSGQEYCFTGAGGQCGYLNDEYVCLTNAPSTGCVVHTDGSTLCGEGALTPPAPSTASDPLVKATPDLTIQGETSTGATPKYDYFSPATTAAAASTTAGATGTGGSTSTPAPGGNAGAAGQDSDGDGYGDGEEEGGGSASGGVDCSAPPSCSGDAIACAILTQEWRHRCDVLEEPTAEQLGTATGLPGGIDALEATGWFQGGSVELAETFDQAPIVSGGCWDDYSLTILGKAVVVPLSSMCTLFQYGGIIVVIVALMVGGRIVVGGF